MNFEDLTDEQKAKAVNAKTPEEILALAKEEGYELSDEELSAVSGGGNGWCPKDCNQVCYHKNCDTWV
ncbi:MAG: Nif11-like leader peptide family natural product precursor [Eggerthellaceae bacterium]|nr:Nif11-like leader peptide family natural product precursor [Eggerthellaceae bacterium]